MIKLSVIVPVYNSSNSLEQCLDSLVKQSFDSFEVIVVNNNSTDNSQDIINDFSSRYPDIMVSEFEEQAGVSYARNRGLLVARGQYIGFVDADDYIEKEMYQKLYSKAISSRADIVITGRNNLLQSGQKKPKLYKDNFFNSLNIREGNGFLRKVSVFVWDKIFSRSLIQENKISFNTTLNYAEDYLFLINSLVRSQKVEVVNECLYNYRVSTSGSITNSITSNILDIEKALQLIADCLKSNNTYSRNREDLYRVALGFYGRRLKAFSQQDNKTIQLSFARNMQSFIKNHFSDIDYVDKNLSKVERLAQLIDKRWKACLYIFTPNWAKSIVFKSDRVLSKASVVKNIYCFFGKCCGLKVDRVLYASFSGANISGSPYHLMKDVQASRQDIKISVATNNSVRDKRFLIKNDISNVELVHTKSLKYIYRLATSKYLVSNSRFPTFFVKRCSQVLLNTWHGTPIKTLGFDIKEGAVDVWRNQNQFLMADYFLVPNPYAKSVLLPAYNLDKIYYGEILESDYPQNEVIDSSEIREDIRTILGVNDKKVIAYMPTWRGVSTGNMDITAQANLFMELFHKLEKELPEDTIVYYNLHQLVSSKIKKYIGDKVQPFPDGFEVYEFLTCTDILITDYSSVMFDYAASFKPVLLYVPDKKEYIEGRGFYFPITELPFPQSESIDQLLSHIKNTNSSLEEKFKDSDMAPYRYESITPARYINSRFFEAHNSECLKERKSVDKRLVFLSGSLSRKEKTFLEGGISKLQDYVFILDANNFSDDLSKYLIEQKCTVVVVPKDTLFNVFDLIALRLWRKFNLFSGLVKKSYDRELRRIVPGINVTEVISFSSRPKYIEMAKIYCNSLGS